MKSLVTEEAPHVRYADDASQVSRITTIIKKLPHTQYETLVRHIMELNGYNVPKPVETGKKRLKRSPRRRFAYRLAVKLGKHNVDDMLTE